MDEARKIEPRRAGVPASLWERKIAEMADSGTTDQE